MKKYIAGYPVIKIMKITYDRPKLERVKHD
jgi:hypothetical protein